VCTGDYTPVLCRQAQQLSIVGETALATAHGPRRLLRNPAGNELIAVCRDDFWILRTRSLKTQPKTQPVQQKGGAGVGMM